MTKPDAYKLYLDTFAEIYPGVQLAISPNALQLMVDRLLARPEAVPTATALAMEQAPTIRDAVMRAMRDHYWDSLEPQKELVLKHVEGALRWLAQSPPLQTQGGPMTQPRAWWRCSAPSSQGVFNGDGYTCHTCGATAKGGEALACRYGMNNGER